MQGYLLTRMENQQPILVLLGIPAAGCFVLPFPYREAVGACVKSPLSLCSIELSTDGAGSDPAFARFE